MSAPLDADTGAASRGGPDGGMSPWLTALLAAAAVEGACAFLATAVLPQPPDGIWFFVACTLAALVADAALVPGWLWARGPFDPAALVVRVASAGSVLLLSTAFAFVLGITVVLLPLSFLLAGAGAGLGAAAAQRVDWRTGPGAPPTAEVSSHVLGGVAGVVVILGAAVVVSWPDPAVVGASWEAVRLGPPAAMLGALPHNLLAARSAARAGHVPPDADLLLRRAVTCCAVLVPSGAAALLAVAASR